jgi:glycosyltransferase involved in cell wall biosynthesis
MTPKVLLSAYACEPGKGSEPGVGWNLANQIAKDYEVWVITRANNQLAIEAELSAAPNGRLHFVYYDLPSWARWWKKGKRGVQLYYYFWQVGIYWIAKKLHAEVEFDLAHHLTFGKYWSPSFISFLPIPFIWGPVGGGESAPGTFWTGLGARGMLFEIFRESARYLAEFDPFVRLTVKRSRLTLAKTSETALRLNKLGAGRVTLLGESALSYEELHRLSLLFNGEAHLDSFKFISIGNFLPLKGFTLGLKAFAIALQQEDNGQLRNAEYWLVGDGPDFHRLQNLSNRLGINSRVKFWGRLSRVETLKKLVECQVLVHPSLHDSGGWVCLEAMAAGRPVICLDLGGPATQVTDKTGFKVCPGSPTQVIQDIAVAMGQLALNAELRKQVGASGMNHVASNYLWDCKQRSISFLYRELFERIRNQNNLS